MIELNTLSLSIFLASFLFAELTSRYFIKEAYFVIKIRNKQKKIKIHHLYVGTILATVSAFFNQIIIFLIGVGIALNDLIIETRNFFNQKFEELNKTLRK